MINTCLWWQLAAWIAKNDSAKLWFFWLYGNVQTVSRDNEGTSVPLSLCPGTMKRLLSLCPAGQENSVPLKALIEMG